MPKMPDGLAARLILRRDGDIALGVETERPVVQIGRADPQQDVVHHGHLGVDDDPLAVLRIGAEGEEAVVPVSAFQPEQDLGPCRVHGHAVEPARAASRRDQHNLRPVWFAQPLGQGVGDDRRGEILVLHIDPLPCAPDGLEVQSLVLADLVTTAEAGLGPGDPDRRVVEVHRQTLGPGIAIDRFRHRPLPGRLEPALARQIAQSARRRSVHDAHGLVPRRRDDPRWLAASRIIVRMGLGIPAIDRDVPAAAKGHGVVDDDRLLMMAGADGARRIQPELDHPFPEPGLGLVRIEALRCRDQQRRLPDQQPDVEFRPGLDHHPQQMADLGLFVAGPGLGVEPGPRVELPAQNHHRTPRLGQSRGQGFEIGAVLHEDRQPVRPLDPPAGLAGRQQGGCVQQRALGGVHIGVPAGVGDRASGSERRPDPSSVPCPRPAGQWRRQAGLSGSPKSGIRTAGMGECRSCRR